MLLCSPLYRISSPPFPQKVAVLESLVSLSLPESHVSLLQPSVQLGKVKRTRKHILNDAQLHDKLLGIRGTKVTKDGDIAASPADLASLVGTTWRRKSRKRRALKAEKVLFHPVPMHGEADVGVESDDSLSESAAESEGEEGVANCGEGGDTEASSARGESAIICLTA